MKEIKLNDYKKFSTYTTELQISYSICVKNRGGGMFRPHTYVSIYTTKVRGII